MKTFGGECPVWGSECRNQADHFSGGSSGSRHRKVPLSEAMAATEVAYRAAESRLDRRNDYTFTFAVLRLALEQTCQEYGDFVMHPAR